MKSLPGCNNFLSSFTATLLLVFVTGTLYAQQPDAWINEFHYDNSGADSGKFIEVIIKKPGTYNLSEFRVDLYNGSDGGSYETETLNNFTVGNSQGDYTIYTWNPSSIQNGPDGIALSYQGNLVEDQLLSYGGTFTGQGGPADGVSSTDIGVYQDSSPAEGQSLQLKGMGLQYADFSWQWATDESPGRVNSGQFLHPTIQLTAVSNTLVENQGTFTITASIHKPDGKEVSADLVFQDEESSAETEDFSGPITQSITFPADAKDGDTRSITFTINSDNNFEGNETAFFRLTNLNTTGSAGLGSAKTFELTITDNDQPDVVINEILTDPDGDANGNGSSETIDDEFVEILNNESVSVDISNWTISDEEGVKFTFDAGTILKANSAAVAFGSSGFQGAFGGSIVQGSGSLSLENSSGDIILKNSNGTTIDAHTYGSEGSNNESLVRDPEGTGPFIGHTSADNIDGSPFSPGTKTDGSNFTNTLTIEGAAGWRVLSSPVSGMQISDLDAPIQGYPNNNASADKNLYVGYDGRSFIPASNLNGQFDSGKGFILYVFNNDQPGSSGLPVTLEASSGSEQTSDVTVALHADGDRWNLLGNPFNTAIDVSGIGSWVDGSNGLQSEVGQIWDSESGTYVTTTTTGDKVAAWQGFFVQNNDATQIQIPTSSQGTGASFFKESGEKGYLALELKAEDASDGVQTVDKAAVLYFHEEATHEGDQYDAAKLLPFSSRFALIGFGSTNSNASGIETPLKAQESRPIDFQGELSFDLYLQTSNMVGEFEVSWTKQDLPDDWGFTLIDNLTGNEIDMNAKQSYKFEYNENSRNRLATERSELAATLPSAETVTAKQEQDPRFTIRAKSGGGIAERSEGVPNSIKLNPNYPNPFNPQTTIPYELKENAEVKLTVWNMIGQKVATLVDGVVEAGTHEASWNASSMPSGIYIARFEVAGKVFTRKMTLIK